MKPNRPAYNRSVGAPRPTPPEATPGFAARWAAAQAIGDALTLARPLEERFPGAGGRTGLARSRRARSSPRALDRHRRDATVRHDPQGARFVARKGHAEKGRFARMDPGRRRGANSVSRRLRSCRGRSGGARRAPRPGSRAVHGARQRGAAQHRALQGGNPRGLRSVRRRYAGVARCALAGRLRRGDRQGHRARAPRGADARHQRQERCRGLGSAVGAAGCFPPVRSGSILTRRSRSSTVTPTASGGCRTPPPRCRRGCCRSRRRSARSTSARRPGANARNSRSPAPPSPRSIAPRSG